ncbi:MAG: hypothetical protein ACTSV2_10840 [Candidatus Thorarchaeota archaeon]
MKLKLLTMVLFSVLLIGTFGIIPSVPQNAAVIPDNNITDMNEIPDDLMPMVQNALAADNPNLPADFDLGAILGDRVNDYRTTYEPWKSKAAIHAISYDVDTGFLAMAGGYLYDNEVHVFRLNTETNEFDKVWDIGDGVFQSDVLSIDFGDTDLNDFIEIVAGCADGHVYVFEQRHLYDPYANTENQFDLVWKSPNMFRAFSVKVDDIDRDYRPDIIAGGWDGQVHIYEYANHSGYPFVEEHWITYDEVATLDVGDKVYSLETGDTNGNGLPEIIVGTRDGTVSVFENDGITLWINDQPFPLIYDNHYYLNWTSENYTWTPITSIAIGELDGDIGDELAIVAQGQGVFTLEWDQAAKTYKYQKIAREYDAWETFGFWGLDYWADSVVEAWNVTYHDPINGSINVPEPINYVWGGSAFDPDASVYPYNTGMAMASDGNMSTFDATDPSVDNATAIIDFGLDEEGTGGANSDADVKIKFPGAFIVGADVSPYFNFSISKDGTDFEQVTPDHFSYSTFYLNIDVDDALSRREWDYFRYAKISVFNSASMTINSLELMQVYNLVTEALTVTIGPLKEDGNKWYEGEAEMDKIIVGTSIGEFLGIKFDADEDEYVLFWESGDDDYYTFGANVWDIEYLGTPTNLPNWNLMAGLNFDPLGGYYAEQWSWGAIDPLGSGEFNMFLSNSHESNDPEFSAHMFTGVYDGATTAYLNDINGELGQTIHDFDSVSSEVPLLPNPLFGTPLLPMFVVGGLDQDTPIEDMSFKYRANILFFYRDDPLIPFESYVELHQLDTDGQLSELVNLAKTTPKMDFADYDGDGDLDFVISNGRVYLAENVIDETGYLNFTLRPGYFDVLNEIESSSIWGQPELHDLDGDGDMDLIMSYDNKYGATAFINEGTAEEPIWVEQKKLMSNPGEDSNMKLLNLTNTRIVPDYGGYYAGLYLEWYDEVLDLEKPEYYMYSYNEYITSLYCSKPVFGASDSYMIASYPKVARLQFNIMEGDVPLFHNLGFHIMEDWNNEYDLEDWTLSITSADTDNDGNGEIIVGDFDNNVYAFEHLVSDTYKRMFRSFDLNHSEISDESPYQYEDLEGISGDFNRRIWDHAKHLVADVDLDQDGLKEIIVAANLQVYIFEEVGLTGGDLVRFVYSIDLRETAWGDRSNFENYATEITAMAAGDDLDYDGRMELAVAAGPYLFIYNIDVESFVDMEDNEFYVTSPVIEGRYFMVGNGDNSNFVHYEINAMTLCDTDQDGYREVIIGGIEDTQLVRQNGFAFIYECVGGTFQQSWIAPSEMTTWNPISVITLDDQDHDGETEIIFGHKQGFDMWEHVPGQDNTYQKVEYVTASPNYPIMPVTTTLAVAETYTTSGRTHKDIAYADAGNFEGWGWMVYESYTGSPKFSHDIFLKFYVDSTGQWSAGATMRNVWTYNGNTSNIVDEYNPTICVTDDGHFYFAWEAYDAGGVHYMATGWCDTENGLWVGAELIPETTGMFWFDRSNPSVFEFNSTHIGIVHTYTGWVVIGDTGCRIIRKDMTGGFTAIAMNYNSRYDMDTHDIDAVRLDDGRIALAMSATNFGTYKPDYDIWVVVSNANFNFTGVTPHQATTSYLDEMYADIDYLRSDDHSLVVLYESVGDVLEDKFKMVTSQNDGATWSIPEELNSLPDYVTRTEYPGGFVTYSVPQPGAYAPTFCALPEGGFMYSFSFSYTINFEVGDSGWFRMIFCDPVYGKNLQSDWALNTLREVVDLDVGDTDADGRREVVVAFGNQIGVYELDSSTDGTGVMSYLEDWLSAEYENAVTGVTVSDSNGNGWDEIALACKRGEVFFLEYMDVSEGTVPIQGSKVNWTFDAGGSSLNGGYDSMASFDLDFDGKEEVIAAPFSTSDVTAIDDDGSIAWTYSGSSLGYRRVFLADVTADGIPEVLLGGRDDVLHILNVTTGVQLWNYTAMDGDIYSIEVADITGDGLVEVMFGTSDGSVWIVHHNGTLYGQWYLALSAVHQIKAGNFTGDSYPGLALTCGSIIVVLDPTNGTILYQSSVGTTQSPCHIRTVDLNNDGLDEVVYGQFGIHILDVLNQEIIYNSSIWNQIWDIWVYDFDGDNSIEIVGMSNTGDIYMEDITGGVLQWYYKPNTEDLWSWDAEIGHFGGSGNMDIAVGYLNVSDTSGGIVIALDGRNGQPIWFNRTNDYPYTVFAADIHGEGSDTAFSWDYFSNNIVAIDSYERIPLEQVEAYPIHERYYTRNATSSWIHHVSTTDLDGDGFNEIAMVDNDNYLTLWDGNRGDLLWNVSIGAIVSGIFFGNIDDTGWLDVIIHMKGGQVNMYTGSTGALISSIDAVASFYVVGVAVGQFDTSSATKDEVVIAYQDGSESFVAWYDDTGTELYRSNNNLSSYANAMTVGHFLSLSNLDVLIGGGGGGDVYIYTGNDGIYQGAYTMGATVTDLITGNFTGDAYDDFAVLDIDYDIDVVNGLTGSLIGGHYYFSNGDIREMSAAQIAGPDGTDELIVNLVEIGIVAYRVSDGSVIWTYSAPLVVGSWDCTMSFEDMNLDGHVDLIFTNREYINVVDGSTAELLWHYANDGSRVYRPIAGHFVSDSGPLDLLSFYSSEFYVVSGITPAPTPPAMLAEAALSVQDEMEALVMIAAIGVPSLLIAVIGSLLWRRKQRLVG